MANVQGIMRRLRSRRRTERIDAASAVESLAIEGGPLACDRLVAAGCVEPLVSMVCSGSPALQAPAAGAMLVLMAKREAATDACAPAIPAIVSMLSADDTRTLGTAAAALARLAEPQHCPAIIAAGGPAALLRVLSGSRDLHVQEMAGLALFHMSCDWDSKAALVDAGAFPPLVALLRSRATDSSTLQHAAYTLANLSRHESGDPPSSAAAAMAAAAAGAPAALVKLLRCSAEARVLKAAAHSLAALSGSPARAVRRAVEAAGGQAALAELVCSSSGDTALVSALGALLHLMVDSAKRSSALAAMPGLLPRLVQLLGDAANADVQDAAADLLERLADCATPAAMSACVAAGVAPALAAALSRSSASGNLRRDCSLLAGGLAEEGHAAALREAGVAPHLRRLEGSSERAVAEAAAWALQQLSASQHPTAAGGSAAEPATPAKPAAQRPQHPRRTCANPGCNATHSLRRCGGCGTVFYCSAACSRAHWRAHRAECRRLQAAQAAVAAAESEASEP